MNDAINNYLIVGLRGIVLADIIDTVRNAFPDFHVITADTLMDASAIVAQLGSVPFAFLNVDPDEFIRTELAIALTRLETRIVLMGDAAEEKVKTSPFPVLDRPFAEDDVIRILKKSG